MGTSSYMFCSDHVAVPSIGAAVLSHHVDEFALVAAFFLFSIGCLNMLVGLIWRESAKSKRSITSWREQGKDVLPTHLVGRPVLTNPPSFVSHVSDAFGHNEKSRDSSHESDSVPSRAGHGFGRQGEKAAALKGTQLVSL